MSINRRLFLGRSASAVTAAALVSTTLPAETATELPVDRVHGLARELALAMDGWCDDLGGLWVAHIHPSKSRTYPITFENVDARPLNPILVLFQKWEDLNNCNFSHLEAEEQDRELAIVCDQMRAVEAEMMAYPSMTAADFAAKSLVVCGCGNFIVEQDDLLWAEARALVGVAS